MSASDAARWRRIGAVFDQVSALAQSEREAALAQACGDDALLLQEVTALLRHDDAAGDADLFAAPARVAASWAASTERETCIDASGRRIGPWRVLRQLGRGGMGVVHLVERADGQFEQRAALKLIRADEDRVGLQRRFLRERQILARLEHPQIARLLDGGIDDDGHPYFAMEYVDGMPLLAHVAERHCSLGERLRLFLDICAAVQFAHRQLVVHRDIKPSNVLVARDGSVKLLDFGIATLIEGRAPDETETAAHAFTPTYAAPEQLRGDVVTTATDVYALGALLYELLTGARPYALAAGTTPQEWLRVISGPACLPPSAAVRVVTAKDVAASAPAPLLLPVAASSLRGDLDLIVLTALRREPERRYASVDAFAEDLRRCEAGLPIHAQRDSTQYRVRKFVARHRLGVALAAAAVLALCGALALALVEARQARTAAVQAQLQASRAQAVKTFLLDTFRVGDPGNVPGGYKLSVKDAIDLGAKRIDAQFAEQPDLAAEFSYVLGGVYNELGEFDASIAMYERARGLRDRVGDSATIRLADIESSIAAAEEGKGDSAAARKAAEAALDLDEAQFGHDDPHTARDMTLVAESLLMQADMAGAGTLIKDAVSISRAHLAADDKDLLYQLGKLALWQSGSGQLEEARQTMTEIVAGRVQRSGTENLDTALAMAGLAEADAAAGHLLEAVPLQQQGLAIQRRLLPPNHPYVAVLSAAQARFELRLHRYAQARQDYETALDIARQSIGETNPTTRAIMFSLARVRYAMGDFAAAAALDREAIGDAEVAAQEQDPHAVTARGELGMALRELGDYTEAEALLRANQADLRAAFGDNSGFVAASIDQLAITLRLRGLLDEALDLHERAQAIDAKRKKMLPGERGAALAAWAETERWAKRPQSAAAHIDLALEQLAQQDPPDDDAVATALIVQGRVLLEQQRAAAAEPILRKALALAMQTWGEAHWRVASAQEALGLCLRDEHRRAEARELLAQAQATLLATRGANYWQTLETQRALAAL
jgi:serine/threonine-protein kinase